MDANNILLKDEKEQYNKEQDELLKTILHYRFFKPWSGDTSVSFNNTSLQSDSCLELYITNGCNQKCEYCYLANNQLYPTNNDPENILKNLRILYDYIYENKWFIPIVEMFSGEIWHTQLGLDILNITYEYAEKGLGIDQIVIPTNGYFLNDPIQLQKIQTLINKFEKIGRRIQFSLSIDGKIIDDKSRPRNTQEIYTDEFYDMAFSFAKRNKYYFHPMIASSNVQYWSENYQWWKKILNHYNMTLDDIMLLEVRNNDWTEKTIKQYCDLVIEIMEDHLNSFYHNDIKAFANQMAIIRYQPQDGRGYVPWIVSPNDTTPACTIGLYLTVRLGDLAICPCHRTAYDKYLYGHFVVENNKIVDIKARNPQMAVKILMSNTHFTDPKCDTCIWNEWCLHGCIGSQIETNKDPFFPIESVCNLFDAKYSCLMQYFKDKGIIEYLKSIDPHEEGYNMVRFILTIYYKWEAKNNGLGKY